MFVSHEEREALMKSSYSEIVFLTDPVEQIISQIFLRLPDEFDIMGVVGKRYDAIKDYIKWKGLNVAYWTPIVYRMGTAWAAARKDK